MKTDKNTTEFKVVRLTAYDWYSYCDQEPINNNFELGTVSIVGFLVAEDDKSITVSMEIFTSHENDLRKIMVIPKGCIIKKEVL